MMLWLICPQQKDELDTVAVPAREDGFNEECLNNNRWYTIRVFGSMLDKIKYIASQQVAPIFGITYIAEVNRIEKYQDTNSILPTPIQISTKSIFKNQVP